MAIWRFEDKYPVVGDTTYVAQSADVIGNVEIGENCYVGPGARIRSIEIRNRKYNLENNNTSVFIK